MGVAHHSHYLVWCEAARTNHMRELGVSYRDLEAQGVRLPVVDVGIKYRAPARYDDLLRIRCWVRDVRSRRVEFGYVVEKEDEGLLLATVRTALIAVDSRHVPTTFPEVVRERLLVTPDPVRL
jgi:acyl-CoA thioester hydrolase